MKPIIYILSFLLIFPILASAKKYESAKQKNTISFNVMTYNIRMNTSEDGINAWPLRKDKVTGLLKFHQPDIFGVQEALLEQMKDLENGLSDFDHVGVGRDDGKTQGETMAIFFRKSRFEKLADGTFWLSENPEKPGIGWDAACNRTCTWVRLKDKLSKQTFYFFNTHLDHRGKIARVNGSKLLLQKISEINNENLPLILTGDFNSTKKDEPIKIINEVLGDSREKTETAPYGPDGTSGGFDVKLMPRIIDYIFVNNNVRVLRYGILSDSFGLYYPSDHLPVFTEMQIK
ncbi:endonuclease/exonuclease/phosphatase family protein [Aquipluma nitroreducens]|uniref:Endonuclease/exonuclease/phosphatase family protein n=1 Tax=Aquipluma nitroreducens TaxID=2010828 RepID=A0A5K7SA39_9BACT|nr:endonuclease/exonuclease/phosphatase family protein [Aquipluma nitroreducens]BBE18430.1 endonuclease/exonuclease/phosphatase family protein [Aquipluma nitroreducens]